MKASSRLLMRYVLGVIIGFAALSLTFETVAQGVLPPVGTWRFYGSTYNATILERTPWAIYGATTTTLYEADPVTLSSKVLSKLDGLSDAQVSALHYNAATQLLVIGYLNGNIDLLNEKGEVYNLPAVVLSSVVGSKRINHISSSGSEAYLSCDFGLVILNLTRKEVRASNTSLGSNGNSAIVYSTRPFQDSLYLSTSNGFRVVPLRANLQNSAIYRPFGLERGVPLGQAGVQIASEMLVFGNQLYIQFKDIRSGESRMGILSSNSHPIRLGTGILAGNRFIAISTSGTKLIALVNLNTLITLNGPGDTLVANDSVFRIGQTCLAGSGNTNYLSLYPFRLIKTEGREAIGSPTPSLFPANVVHMASLPNGMMTAAGIIDTRTYTQTGNQGGYSILTDTGWANNNYVFRPQNTYFDCIHVGYSDRYRLRMQSLFGGGLLLFSEDSLKETLINERFPGSTLNSTILNTPGFCRVTCSAVDQKGFLWIGNFINPLPNSGLHRFDLKTRQMTAINPPSITAKAFQSPVDILVADNNDKWVRIAPDNNSEASIWVYADNGTQRIVNTVSGTGNLPAANVNDIAKDIDGAIWLGTDKGLAVFYSPSSVTRNARYDCFLPIFDGRPILENEAVTAIAIDGGGRKWVGTRSSGIFLFDRGLTKTLARFTVDNSPLASNQILDIAIQPTSGEVFFATDKGLMSYRDIGTDPKRALTDGVKVFPNPVRPRFDGAIGITGLPANSQVKITDLAGRKVYDAKAAGGGISWNLFDYTGNRAATGIYLIFAATEEGESQVGKFVVVE